MLPSLYQLPAALVLLLAGVLACFSGYRLFRTVLAIFGFIIGAAVASSLFGEGDTGPMLVAALVGGLIGAGVLLAAYFVGVALVGAGLGAVVAHMAYAAAGRDPHLVAVVLCAIVGAAGAMYFQRYVIIVGTAIGGAWTLIVAGIALVEPPADRPGGVWVLYPLDPAPGQEWVPVTWVVLAVLGTCVQLGWTGGGKGRAGRRRRKSQVGSA